MNITTGNNDMLSQYNNFNINSNDRQIGYNGLTGFQNLECYMLIKFGHNNNFNVPDKSQYLIELPMYPENVTEGIDAQWATQNILGRSAPVAAYANTSLKSVNFELDLHRDLLTGSFSHTNETMMKVPGMTPDKQPAGSQLQTGRGPFGTRTWYVNINKMLQMSVYPQYTSRGLIPPITYFVFGQMILKGYVTHYQTTWKKPIINSFYAWNNVSITMDCYPDSIISADEIIESDPNGSIRGNADTQNTYNTKFPTSDAIRSNVMTRSTTNNRPNSRNASSLGGNIRTT